MSRTKDLYLCVESSCNNSDFSFDYEKPVSIGNIEQKIAEEVMSIMTSPENNGIIAKKIQCSKVGAYIEFENCFGVKFEYRLSIMRMMRISELDLNASFVNSVW